MFVFWLTTYGLHDGANTVLCRVSDTKNKFPLLLLLLLLLLMMMMLMMMMMAVIHTAIDVDDNDCEYNYYVNNKKD